MCVCVGGGGGGDSDDVVGGGVNDDETPRARRAVALNHAAVAGNRWPIHLLFIAS